jgi:hypothetical protein
VTGRVVHHDDIARPPLGDQNLLDMDLEGVAVDRPIEDKGAAM